MAALRRIGAGLVVALVCSFPAGAMTPGGNGGISYTSFPPGDIRSVLLRPDGTKVFIDGSFVMVGSWDATGERISSLTAEGVCGSSWSGGYVRWPSGTRHPLFDCNTWGHQWSPDGDRLVWFSGGHDIRVTNVRRDSTREIVSIARNRDPAWAPNGRVIVFVSRRDGNWELYRMAPDGSGQQRITATPGAEGEPDWSPDSRSVVFVRGRDIWTRNLATGAERRLTRSRMRESSPVWSPDGSFVAFSRPINGELRGIYVYRLDDGRTRLLTTGRRIDDLSWRPLCMLQGSDSSNWLRSGEGRDLVCGRGGSDTVWSGPGNDVVYGEGGDDRLHGGRGDDVLVGGPGRDVLEGGPGRDLLNSRDGRGGDVVRGGPADICRADPRDRVIGC